MRFLLMISITMVPLASTGCGKGEGDKEKTYDIKGTVVSLDTAKKTVELNHEDIPGLMKGMQMNFDVRDAKVVEGLKPGDNVQGRLTAKRGDYTITELHKR